MLSYPKYIYSSISAISALFADCNINNNDSIKMRTYQYLQNVILQIILTYFSNTFILAVTTIISLYQ